MFSDRAFQIALILSLIAHGIILSQSPNFNLHLFSRDKKEQKIEVSYVKPQLEPRELKKRAPLKKEPLLKLPSKITATQNAPAPYIDKESIFKKGEELVSREFAFDKPALIKPDVIAVKKKISLPPVDLDKIDNPSYISYYQIVREKIRRAAYQNYSRLEVGEVYLSFVILANGQLKEVRLIGEKSSFSLYLREIALKSIKEAAPFPSFPRELDYPHLSFNVVISFEVE